MGTKDEMKAAVEVMKAIGDAIREAGRVPAGVLYATLSVAGCSKHSFDLVVSMFTNTVNGPALVRREGDVLVWNG